MRIKVVDESDAIEPCRDCGKTLRGDVDGYCLDCADENGISEHFSAEERQKNWRKLHKKGVLSRRERNINVRKMQNKFLREQTQQVMSLAKDKIDELPEQERAPFEYLVSQMQLMKELRIEMLTNDLGLPFEEADRIFEKFSRLLNSIGIFDGRDFENEKVKTITDDPKVHPWIRKLRALVSVVADVIGYRLMTKEESARYDAIQEKREQIQERKKEQSNRRMKKLLLALALALVLMIAIASL